MKNVASLLSVITLALVCECSNVMSGSVCLSQDISGTAPLNFNKFYVLLVSWMMSCFSLIGLWQRDATAAALLEPA